MLEIDNANWREEYKAYTSSKYELELLERGPQNLSQSWVLGALHYRWKKIKGIKDTEPPNCQSSYKEFESRIQQLKLNHDSNNSFEKS